MNKTPIIALPTLLFAIAFSLLLLLLQQVQPTLLYQREAIVAGEAWRLWSGNLVHTNHYHLLLNLAGFWIFLLFCDSVVNLKLLIFSIFVNSTAIGAALLLMNPEIHWYAGLSGVLYGLFVIGAARLALAGEVFNCIVLIGMVLLKLGSAWFGDTDVMTEDMIGAAVIEEAHVYGVLAGSLIATYYLYQALRNRQSNN